MAGRKAKAARSPRNLAAPVAETLKQFAKVEQLALEIARGRTQTECFDLARLEWPGENPVTLYDDAVGEIRKAASVDDELLRGWAVHALRDIYRRLLDAGELDAAMKALKLLLEVANA